MIADDNNNTIVVDVIVAKCQFRALRPVFDSKNAMPNSGAEKLVVAKYYGFRSTEQAGSRKSWRQGLEGGSEACK
jgi:hypothetical protein